MCCIVMTYKHLDTDTMCDIAIHLDTDTNPDIAIHLYSSWCTAHILNKSFIIKPVMHDIPF